MLGGWGGLLEEDQSNPRLEPDLQVDVDPESWSKFPGGRAARGPGAQ